MSMSTSSQAVEKIDVTPLTLRDKVHIIEAEMLKQQEHVLTLPLQHFFVPGAYAREILIPKGNLVAGRTHKYPQINIVSQGDLSILTDDGWLRVQAPYTVVSPAGTKRLVYTHEDTVFTTIIGTNETDIDKIEAALTAASEAEYTAFLAQHPTLKEIT